MSTEGLPGPGDDLPARAAAVVRARHRHRSRTSRSCSAPASARRSAMRSRKPPASRSPTCPGFPPPGVPGHAGRLVLGHLAGVPVAAFFGRVHFYEGHGMDVPALLPRLARELGAGTMVLTAAVGGLVPGEAAGTVVVVRDHLNMMGAAPLRGWRYPDGMPAFISTPSVYDAALRELAFERAQALGIASSVGVYAAMSGPAYETPTEVALLRSAGATVVGMSMVPEALPAAALGMRVLGICS